MEPTTEFVDERGLSAWINVSTKTLAAWRSKRLGPPYVKLGRGLRAAVRYRVADVREWLARGTKIEFEDASSAITATLAGLAAIPADQLAQRMIDGFSANPAAVALLFVLVMTNHPDRIAIGQAVGTALGPALADAVERLPTQEVV